ncbi:MAG: DMT family transporter [Burkholderiaceae bacterium]
MTQSPSGAASTQDALIRAMPVVFVLIWSTGFIVARYGVPNSPPLKFLVVRYILSALCLAAWAWWARAAWPQGRTQWKHLAITGVLMQAAYLGGVWVAIGLGAGAGVSAMLVGLQPVLTAWWLSSRGGQVSGRQWAGLVLGFAGLLLVVSHKLGYGEITAANLTSLVIALLGITAGTLYQKRFVAPCDVRTASAVQMLAALVVTLPLTLFESRGINVNLDYAAAMAWSVLGLTMGGSSLLYLLIQRGAAASVSSLMYLVPPCTATMAWLLFGEPITLWTVAGMMLTAVGVALVVRAPAAKATG